MHKYKKNILKSVSFLITNKELAVNGNQKISPIENSFRNKTNYNQHLLKYLVMVLTKMVKEFYTEKFKFLSALRKTGI